MTRCLSMSTIVDPHRPRRPRRSSCCLSLRSAFSRRFFSGTEKVCWKQVLTTLRLARALAARVLGLTTLTMETLMIPMTYESLVGHDSNLSLQYVADLRRFRHRHQRESRESRGSSRNTERSRARDTSATGQAAHTGFTGLGAPSIAAGGSRR